MAKHYFTHSFAIDAGGDTSNLPAVEDLSVVVEGLFFSTLPQTGDSGVGTLTVSGFRKAAGVGPGVAQDALFYFNRSATDVVSVNFPVRGKTNEGAGVSFTLGPSGAPTSGFVVVWGYYTDE